jgi:hypothetical protein
MLDDDVTFRGPDRFADEITTLVRHQVAIIVTSGTPAAFAAKEATIGFSSQS